MTSWLDTPLSGRELVEYAVSRIPADWSLRKNGQVVGHAAGTGQRPLSPAEREQRRRRRSR